jgi:hypothetical protein
MQSYKAFGAKSKADASLQLRTGLHGVTHQSRGSITSISPPFHLVQVVLTLASQRYHPAKDTKQLKQVHSGYPKASICASEDHRYLTCLNFISPLPRASTLHQRHDLFPEEAIVSARLAGQVQNVRQTLFYPYLPSQHSSLQDVVIPAMELTKGSNPAVGGDQSANYANCARHGSGVSISKTEGTGPNTLRLCCGGKPAHDCVFGPDNLNHTLPIPRTEATVPVVAHTTSIPEDALLWSLGARSDAQSDFTDFYDSEYEFSSPATIRHAPPEDPFVEAPLADLYGYWTLPPSNAWLDAVSALESDEAQGKSCQRHVPLQVPLYDKRHRGQADSMMMGASRGPTQDQVIACK